MRIFNEDKTTELNKANIDTAKGYFKYDKLFVAHHDKINPVEAKCHYETIKKYDNGGADVKLIIDTPKIDGREAYDEYEDIMIFIPYSIEELKKREILTLKSYLSKTDYKAIKYAEGVITAAEYAETKAQRQSWRDRINELEKEIL